MTTTALLEALPDDGDPDAVYEAVATWASEGGTPLYPHQDEALLEIVTGSHVICATPTGSGKSLIALGAHASALARGVRTFYTAPIKALVSEKFFALAAALGAHNVGMMTGDTTINPGAPVICCTAEILAHLALRGSVSADVEIQVVMDEFHFYADPQRGWAWQTPLLELPRAQFVLLSATLGDVSFFVSDLQRRTGREVAVIADAERPVPLSFTYSTVPLQELLVEMTQTHRSPVYVVHFTQASAVERAQSLTSITVASRDKRDLIAAALKSEQFGRGFGHTLSRLLRHGIGVHHAGMLPRYRRLVERLTQANLLAVVCGTDTLGVGVNMPIRTVVLTSLTKYDGERTRHLTAREFHQIAGRAGRAGFDTLGEVVVQAPEHVIENARALAKAGDDERKRRKIVRKKAPSGAVNWTDKTFERLRDAGPEPLTSQFRVTHTMALGVLARSGDPVEAMRRLLTDNHEPPSPRNLHLRQAIRIYRSLRAAGVVERLDPPDETGRRLRLAVDLPPDFALNAPLSPFALAAFELLDPEAEPRQHALDVVSIVESTLEGPRPVLVAQAKAARGEAVAAMKADGLEYDERMALLEDVTHPRPLAELLEAALALYARSHPWVRDHELQPKSVVREMVEHGMTFTELISRYGLARSEGVVLRYLSDAYRALRQVVPEDVRNSEVDGVIEWLGQTVRLVDSSLIDEWESMQGIATSESAIAAGVPTAPAPPATQTLTGNPRALRVALRGAAFRRVELLAREAYGALAQLHEPDGWGTARWAETLAPYWQEYDDIGVSATARSSDLFLVDDDVEAHPGTWRVAQVLDDPAGDRDWRLVLDVDLAASDEAGELVICPIHLGALPIVAP